MAIVKLTPAADLDLLEIWYISDDRWDTEQADTYLRKLDARMTFLANNPKRGRLRKELPGHPMSYHEERHTIFYRRIKTGIEVIRLFHNSMDFSRHLGNS